MSSNQPYPPDPRVQPGYSQPPTYETPDGVANNTVQSVNGDGVQVQSQRESYVDPAGNRVENRAEVYQDDNVRRANLQYWITRVVYFILGVLEILLLLRFLFRLLGANEGSSFVMFLYNLTHVFVGPFNGIFNDQALGHSVFEFSTIVAMIVYALIAWGIVSLCRLIFAPRYGGRETFTTTRRRRLT